MIMYQKVMLSNAASFAAQQGAEIWTDGRRDILTGEWSSESTKDSLYQDIIEIVNGKAIIEKTVKSSELKELYGKVGKKDSTGIERKSDKIERLIYKSLSKGLLKPDKTYISAKFENTIIQRKIEVTLRQEIKIPLGTIAAIFGGKGTFTVESKGVATVEDPAEFIRNVDLGFEYASRVKETIGLEDLFNKAGQSSGK
jgi:hypothetical protein